MESEKWSQLHHAEIFISKFMKQMDKEKIEVTFRNLYADIVIELMWIDVDTKQETSIAMLQPQSRVAYRLEESHRRCASTFVEAQAPAAQRPEHILQTYLLANARKRRC